MTSSNKLDISKSVEIFFLPLNWKEINRLFNDIKKNEFNLLYTILSNIFDMLGNIVKSDDSNLGSIIFLWSGITFAIFTKSGQHPVDKNKLHKYCTGNTILGMISISNFIQMPS